MKKSTAIITLAIIALAVFGLLSLANSAESYMAAPQTDAELIETIRAGGTIDLAK